MESIPLIQDYISLTQADYNSSYGGLGELEEPIGIIGQPYRPATSSPLARFGRWSFWGIELSHTMLLSKTYVRMDPTLYSMALELTNGKHHSMKRRDWSFGMLLRDTSYHQALTPSTISSLTGLGMLRGINLSYEVRYNGSIRYLYVLPLQNITPTTLFLDAIHDTLSLIFSTNNTVASLNSSNAPNTVKIPRTRENMWLRWGQGIFWLYGRQWDIDSNNNSSDTLLIQLSNRISEMECYIFDTRWDLLDPRLRYEYLDRHMCTLVNWCLW